MSEETSQPSVNEEALVTDNGDATDQQMSYANGKYNTVSDLEKGYEELQKSYSQKLGAFEGAPESYELAEGVNADSRIEALMQWGKDNQLSNKALNDIIALDMQSMQESTEAYAQEQHELLGKNATERINNLKDWANAHVGSDNIEAFNEMITSAKSVEVMESIMKKMTGTAPAAATASKPVDADTVKQMRFAMDEFGNRRMSVDPEYRRRVEALEAQMFTNA